MRSAMGVSLVIITRPAELPVDLNDLDEHE